VAAKLVDTREIMGSFLILLSARIRMSQFHIVIENMINYQPDPDWRPVTM
jgi:hypothetical protein